MDARARRTGGVERRGVRHFADWRDAGNRLLREAAERVRHRTYQLAVDVHRAAAHPGYDTGVRERTAFEARQNQVPVRADDVFEDAQNVRFEFFDVRAVKDRPPDADHAGTDVVHPHVRRIGGRVCSDET